jgi:hypothetical protein
MRLVERSEILPLGDYEAVRPRFRARVVAEKARRRARLGEHLSVLFENHDSVLLQVQEMLRTERITSEAGIAHELETYTELVPRRGELSLTLFVEIPDAALRERLLRELALLEEHVWLEVDGERFAFVGEREGREARQARTTAVHYLKATLSQAAQRALEATLEGGSPSAALVIDHPAYPARAELSRETCAALAADLREPSDP